MLNSVVRTLLLLCLLMATSLARATSPGDSASTPVAGCTEPEYRRLDFRLGEFDVTGIGGARAGESRVVSMLQGCLLVEEWQGAISGEGRAHMFYDRLEKRWHLIYITDDGATLYLAGNFAGDALVLQGENDFDAFTGLHRMSFSPLPGDRSLQRWELSADGGRTWTLLHEGTFVRRH
jgi:hypothetical protein